MDGRTPPQNKGLFFDVEAKLKAVEARLRAEADRKAAEAQTMSRPEAAPTFIVPAATESLPLPPRPQTVDIPKTEPLAHPILSRKLRSAIAILEGAFEPEKLGISDEASTQAFLVDLAHAAFLRISNRRIGTFVLHGFTMREPLPHSGSHLIQVVIGPDSPEGRVLALFSQPAAKPDADWTLHAETWTASAASRRPFLVPPADLIGVDDESGTEVEVPACRAERIRAESGTEIWQLSLDGRPMSYPEQPIALSLIAAALRTKPAASEAVSLGFAAFRAARGVQYWCRTSAEACELISPTGQVVAEIRWESPEQLAVEESSVEPVEAPVETPESPAPLPPVPMTSAPLSSAATTLESKDPSSPAPLCASNEDETAPKSPIPSGESTTLNSLADRRPTELPPVVMPEERTQTVGLQELPSDSVGSVEVSATTIDEAPEHAHVRDTGEERSLEEVLSDAPLIVSLRRTTDPDATHPDAVQIRTDSKVPTRLSDRTIEIAKDDLLEAALSHDKPAGTAVEADTVLAIPALGKVAESTQSIPPEKVKGAESAAQAARMSQAIRWIRLPRIVREPTTARGGWLVLSDEPRFGVALGERFLAQKQGCTVRDIPETNFEGWVQMMRQLRNRPEKRRGVVFFARPKRTEQITPEGLTTYLRRGLGHLMDLFGAAASISGSEPIRIWILTSGAERNGYVSELHGTPLWSFGRWIATEHPEHFGGLIDLDPDMPLDVSADQVASEVLHSDGEDQIDLLGGERFGARLMRSPISPMHPDLPPESSSIVTVGNVTIGRLVCRWLVAKGARRITLVGREWSGGEAASFDEFGDRVRRVSVDLTKPEDVQRLIRDTPSPIGAIVHCASILEERARIEGGWSRFWSAVERGILGAWYLHEATINRRVESFVTVSPTPLFAGAVAEGATAAAAGFLDALAQHRRGLGLPTRNLAVGPWPGVTVHGQLDRRSVDRGVRLVGEPVVEAALDHTAVDEILLDVDWVRYGQGRNPSRFFAYPETLAPKDRSS